MKKKSVELKLYYKDSTITDLLERLEPTISSHGGYFSFGKAHAGWDSTKSFPYGGYVVYSNKKAFNSDFKDLEEIKDFVGVYGYELAEDFYDKDAYWVEPVG